jgi:hypothetical protein
LGGLTTSGFVWRREPGRWEVADPAQAFAYPGQLGGSGNSAAWSSLVSSIDDMVRERPQSRLAGIATHNRSLGRLFAESLKPAMDQIQFVTPFWRGRPPSGLVTIGVSPTAGTKLIKDLEAAGFEFSALESETVHWRSKAPNRFLLEYDPEYPLISRASSTTPVSPEKARTDLRFCFHYWHKPNDVQVLAEEILRSLSIDTL